MVLDPAVIITMYVFSRFVHSTPSNDLAFNVFTVQCLYHRLLGQRRPLADR